MPRSLEIARKDFRDIFRERTIVLAFVLQLFIAGFSSFLLVGLVSLYDPSQAERVFDARIAYVGPGGFDRHLRDATPLRITTMDAAGAKQLFDAGRVDAIIEEIYSDPSDTREVNILLPEGELQTTLLVTLMKDHLKRYEQSLREDRSGFIQTKLLYVEQERQSNPYFAFAYALLVPLLLIIPAFLAGAVAADAMTQEVETRTLELLRSSPAGSRGIFLGKILAPLSLGPVQGVVWIILFGLNGIEIHNPIPILILITALTCMLVCAAVFFGLALKKPGDAQVAYSLFVLLVLAASYLTPQPILAALARLSVGSLEALEVGSLVQMLVAAALVLAAGLALAPRMIQRLQ